MFKTTLCAAVVFLKTHQELVLENVALRNQLDVLQRNSRKNSPSE
jgi:hypothetical protein